jgi:hypothetical protein
VDRQKFVDELLYAAWLLREDEAGGAVKLNKVLYYAEFGHMREYGVPISGARFFKLDEGPAPRALLPVRQELVDQGRAELLDAPFLGFVQNRLVPTESPDPDQSSLTADERRSIEQAVMYLDGMNAHQVSELSHLERGWQLVDFEEDIPYETAFLAQSQELTPSIKDHIAELAAARGLIH